MKWNERKVLWDVDTPSKAFSLKGICARVLVTGAQQLPRPRPVIEAPDPFHFSRLYSDITFLPQKAPGLAIFSMLRVSQMKLV